MMRTIHSDVSIRGCRERGLTLIELMISMVVGLIVVLVVTNMAIGNSRSSRVTTDIASMQESARFGFDVLGMHLRIAGFHRDGPRTFDNLSPNCAASEGQALCGINDTAGPNSSDEVRVRFYGSDGPTVGVSDGGTVDCAGNNINEATIVEERFRVELVQRNPNDAATAVPTLVCHVLTGSAAIQAGNEGPAVPLVFGVETMQVLYGEDTDGDAEALVDRWRPAGAANMPSVRAVRVSLLVTSPGQSASEADASTYRLFGSDYAAAGDAGAVYVAPGDRLLRRTVNLSAFLRSRG